ncbi:Palmitoyltransferase TIP1, putative [Theobroma cacao]|uniref:S-acyltransferase n=1 Tax=Theobroma cacao TaxID=3641 RepID=A0A061E4W4_THECC|nr:Palmitoyltransferase TIP1, putative [Theobroma cacao]
MGFFFSKLSPENHIGFGQPRNKNEDGASLTTYGGNGYYALQWAALDNFPDIAQYLIEHGRNVNAIENNKQTAFNWAAVRGSIAVADVLLQNGARVEATDINGCWAVHVAAQYGQTAFLNHIVAKYHADYDAPDNDGRAAYKGFADTTILLLFRDASQGRQDKEGTKQELVMKDKAGFTPIQLAYDKGHRQITLFLSNAARANSNRLVEKFCSGKMGDVGYAPILFCVIIVLIILFINAVLAAPSLSRVTAIVGLWGWIDVSLGIGSLIMFYRCSSFLFFLSFFLLVFTILCCKDPGHTKKNGGLDGYEDTEAQAFLFNNSNRSHLHNVTYDPLLSVDMNNLSVWTGNWSQLCPTCKIIRPIRSKHCPVCKHCIEQFNHHCPWISNCVGKKNKQDCFVFVCMGTLTSFLAASIAVQRIWTAIPALPADETWIHHVIVHHPGIIAFLILDAIVLIAATTLTTVQVSQIARNITANELSNAIRYGYLRGPDGRFQNPYNHGCRKNCPDFLIRG